MKFAAWYSIVVGAMMLVQWGFFITAGQVVELQTEPIRIAFHLAAEGATAIILLVSGIGLLQNKRWSRELSLVAMGMLMYTSIVSPGYFAQQGIWALVGMFAVVLLLAVVSIRMVAQSGDTG